MFDELEYCQGLCLNSSDFSMDLVFSFWLDAAINLIGSMSKPP